jgi:hypothetical protein
MMIEPWFDANYAECFNFFANGFHGFLLRVVGTSTPLESLLAALKSARQSAIM